MIDLLSLEFMRNSMIAAMLVGASAPLVGVFLVQRGMSLIGDGMGHVALAGVGVGILTQRSPVLTALIVVVAAAVAIEMLRHFGRTSGDLALAVMFYGGIAAGVVIISKAPQGSSTNLQGYLFGALNTVSRTDLTAFAVLAAVVLVTVLVLRERLFAVSQDQEYAQASGLPVLATNILLAVLTGVTVVISMRVIGLLLISALMILPNATGQQLGRSFRSGLVWAVVVGLATSVGGVVTSFYADTPSGATIVLLAIVVFISSAVGAWIVALLRRGQHEAPISDEHEHWQDCGHLAVLHNDHVDFFDEDDPQAQAAADPEGPTRLEGSQR